MNTRKELDVRLAEIKRAAAALPGADDDVKGIYYELARLSSWTTRTMNFLSTMEQDKPCRCNIGECDCRGKHD